MFKRLFNNQSQTITSAAIILGAASLASRLLGLFRDRILAGTFGAGDELDIYWAAFRIPDLVYNLLVIGALSAGFIPVFTSYLNNQSNLKNDPVPSNEAWYLASGVLNILIVSLILICGILAIFTPWLMRLITPGFTGQKLAMTVSLSRIMFLSPIFLGVSAVLGGILQSFRRFFVFSLAPIMYNLGIVFGALVLVKFWGLYGLAAGVILGAMLHLLIQIPSVVFCGFSYRLVFDWGHQGIKKISQLMIPRTLSLATNQITWLGMTIIASTLSGGSLAVFNFANNLQSFPLGIIGLSFAVAAFPTLSQWATKKDWPKFVENLSSTTRQILFFMIPASAMLIVLRAQIVRVILGTGKFDWQDTILTIETLQYFCFGLFAQALVYLLIRGFFALEDTKTPFFIGLAVAGLEILLAFVLVKKFSVAGLGLALSLGSFLLLGLLWFFLRRKIGSLDEKRIFRSTIKIITASFLAALAAYGMLHLVAPIVNMRTGLGVFIQGMSAGLVGLAVYILVGLFLKCQESITFWQVLKHRLPWSRVAPKEEVISEQ